MSSRLKNSLYALGLLVAIWAVWKYRQLDRPSPLRLEGKTMGTTYHITYFDEHGRNFQFAVDSLLEVVNQSINTYDPSSEISQFNRARRSFVFRLPYFLPPLKKSLQVVAGSHGAYDPTVGPLVNAWGFGAEKILRPDTAAILDIRPYVGFEKISFNNDSIWKSDPRVQVDFGAIGQGYGADVIADFFRSQLIGNFFIELGGEGVASGKNLRENRSWEIGILDPHSDFPEQSLMATAMLNDIGYSTSGNYFNFREVDGRKYAHTIDPVSGFPIQRELLSATVFASDCSTADAWATAFMAMGHVQGIELLKDHPELMVYFIYSDPEGVKTFTSGNLADNVRIRPR
ncbi:MAG: FAD:protein FMN transferase [Cytophagales bacterium]|nr:FAD:protein FMN transferase [Cytophagales bacterium]